MDENAGRASASFEIKERPKIRIGEIEFAGAQAFAQKRLRKVIKTRRHWMFSWITGTGVLKDEQFEEDKEKLAEFYRNGSGKLGEGGYLDFEIKNVEFLTPTPRTMMIRFTIYEGTQYKVGPVKFTGNKIFNTADITNDLRSTPTIKPERATTYR